MQHTIKAPVTFNGTGLHSGLPANLTIRPAAPGTGIRFRRTDIALGDSLLPARWDLVERTPLCTRLVNAAGASVSTVEHVMAALSGCGISNALLEIDGPEVPILDGSSAPFVRGILARGLAAQHAPHQAIEILREVEVSNGQATARLKPAPMLEIAFEIDFDEAAIGHQTRTLTMKNGAFVRELCDSRTFCRNWEVDALREQGLALGGTLENAVVVDGDQILTPGGLRHSDEPVRHKMLDALGDLYMAGAPILGRYEGIRAGHSLTNTLLRALFADPANYRYVTIDRAQAALLPGAGVTSDEIPAVA
ncbi:UDP-3-O-acyl-N-acetylglucosamine deacetylase [Pseudooceanicola sp. CBS1P-1]|uniref:UDP-3-O-acyl-N-acetylglucosamine deacetylase n=1 Tax=Pseudooceanicola albus TaxID=2692189 RepID=A0A6L7G0U2_9RHOB|nr:MULTISPECIES: UDP-3-O-acyl-N-acetylglucosamine deacetylase [Pseudooceanicola]MBT9382577.1 UDP-3-O-acyl-N-acetylglucosamine deacetylase [Pseudooceanicola endophyticus]MXN17118.1 UDP-3-O-acyl-N-acetylglucosamine deacetylase [Pseudooceanicola albus]